MVGRLPIGSGASSAASAASGGGTNHSIGTRAVAASTRRSRSPRAASCAATMRRRRRRVSGAGRAIACASCLPGHRLNYPLTRSRAPESPVSSQSRPRLLLLGDPSARPDGLERFLVRGGFEVTETGAPGAGGGGGEAAAGRGAPPDVIVFSAGAADANVVGHAFGLTHCSFVLTAPGEEQGRVVAVYENPAIRDLRVHLERYPEIQEALRTERPVVIHDVQEHPLFESIRKHWLQQQIDVNVQSAVAIPVFVQGRAAGVFFLRTVQGEPQLRTQDVAFANTIAQAAARVLENEEHRAAIYRRQISAGTTDPLTGCASLDALDRRLRDEFERARRYQLRVALVVLDVDPLRDINARLGQAAGDRVLGQLGAMLQREIRAPDFVARYGGDEFALVLPETDGPGARRSVERLRGVLARHAFPDLAPGEGPRLCAGAVAYPHAEVLRPEDLFALAEGALAQGKADNTGGIGLAEPGKAPGGALGP